MGGCYKGVKFSIGFDKADGFEYYSNKDFEIGVSRAFLPILPVAIGFYSNTAHGAILGGCEFA